MSNEKIILDGVIRLVVGELCQAMQTLFGNRCKKIVLYGSYARSEQEPYSDIDFMVIVDMDENELRTYDDMVFDKSYEITLKHGVLLSVMSKSEHHFLHWVDVLPFYDNIRKEGLEFHAC
jgi:predicted nucleotidyltransferase